MKYSNGRVFKCIITHNKKNTNSDFPDEMEESWKLLQFLEIFPQMFVDNELGFTAFGGFDLVVIWDVNTAARK